MNDTIKCEKSPYKLGLPPMELAETNDRKCAVIKKCVYPYLQKILALILVILFVTGVYIVLVNFLQGFDCGYFCSTEIIIVNENAPNVTINQGEVEIFVQFKNKTSQKVKKRSKRDVPIDVSEKLDDDKIRKARELIMKQDLQCNDNNKAEICKQLVTTITSLDIDSEDYIEEDSTSYDTHQENKFKDIDVSVSTEITKRETNPLDLEVFKSAFIPLEVKKQSYGYITEPGLSPEMTHASSEHCLHSQMPKQHHPRGLHHHDYTHEKHLEKQLFLRSRLIPTPSFIHARKVTPTRKTMHPQDVAIMMHYLNPEPHERSTNVSNREVACVMGSVSCLNGESCILESQWCDGNVDCSDVSDETGCSCKSRVDKTRLCDGFFDCPFGEDEMGCYGCSDNIFSCMDLDINSHSTCFSKEQRCNNLADCPNRRDELDCTMLSPTLHSTALFAVSNTEGFLHRNFKGDWYAVCKNPYLWAHDACRKETGLILRPPFIQVLPIDPMLKVNYLNTDEGGLLHMSDTCFNNSAMYVTCPDLLCGTRIMPGAQILRENEMAENHLFGRNKRFLLRGHPYNFIFYNDRAKREIDDKVNIDEETDEDINGTRQKRAESRVVGGKPSQPAAWPWMVAMYRDGMFHCGGVVLTQIWIISAAHCVHKFWEHFFEIRVGMLRRFSFSPQEQNYEVTHVIVNQFYNREDMKNDLSLLKVEPAIQFSKWVRPICLPGPETAGPDWLWGPPAGTICTAVGWGATEEHGPDPDHLREVEIPVWEKCKHREDKAGKEICAGLVQGGKDACQGDSGGPLLCKNPLNPQQWYMAGIVSHGDGCGRKNEPGVYTRVSIFVKWIRYHIFAELPSLRPTLECPGFKCISGIAKCLPSKRVCDKIVDCLGGEDESNCNSMRSTQTLNNLFIKPSQKDVMQSLTENHRNKEADILDKLFLRKSDEDHQTDSDQETGTLENMLLTTSLKDVMPSLTTIKSQKYYQTKEAKTEKDLKKTTDNKNNIKHIELAELLYKKSKQASAFQSQKQTDTRIDVIKESKLEIPNDKHDVRHLPHGEAHQDDDDNNEPVMGIEEQMKLINRGDLSDSISVTFPKTNLETMSSITKKYNQKEADIQENWSDEANTTQVPFTSTPSNNNNMIDDQLSNILSDEDSDNDTTTLPTTEIVPTTTDTAVINGPESKVLPMNFPQSHITLGPQDIEKNDTKLDLNENGLEFEDLIFNVDKTHKTQNHVNNPIMDETNFNILVNLKPAKLKRQYNLPRKFECRHIQQNIPYHQRCDRKADCEDGTDELSCTCIDYLIRFDSNLLCDGISDCADGQDEIDCYTCPEDYTLCHKSQQCVPTKNVCDGTPHCPLAEDEYDCFALTNGKNIEFNIDGVSNTRYEGFLTRKHKKTWDVVCEEDLSAEQQEVLSSHICRYLGFSSANRHLVKHINLPEENNEISKSDQDSRNRRYIENSAPVHFTYRASDDTARHIINKPQVLKEQCVPNVTKTCMSLYVYCDHSLFSDDLNLSNEAFYSREAETHMWPWVAKLFVDGKYRCSGVLVDLSWVLVSHSCLWDTLLSHHYLTIILGSHRTLPSTKGLYEQIIKVDAKKDLYHTKAALLHLKKPANYSIMVKPMVALSRIQDEKPAVCVAIGQNEENITIGMFLEEFTTGCDLHNRCFKKNQKKDLCSQGMKSQQPWAGVISCHSDRGWYPAATFVDSRGECGVGNSIIGSEIGNLRIEMKNWIAGRSVSESAENNSASICDGVRCGRGGCIKLAKVCDGVPDCEDQNDEKDDACGMKKTRCNKEPFQQGCECSSSQLKCHNGHCISKQLFRDGNDDCGDGTDEPNQKSCAYYIARVKPGRLCDGILHCADRSDEDPMFCKCFAKKAFKCNKFAGEVDLCVSHDVVCDGVNDCPNGEDEQTCLALSAPVGTTYGTGEVIHRSYGVWHTQCYETQNHTKLELEAICKQLGFISGHAKQLRPPPNHSLPSKFELDKFNEVVLNNHTRIELRNTDEPLAKTIYDDSLNNCYPVYIECL